ncbi:MAG: DUF4358 domain-containing protein [Eubacteriales bacterium]
MKSGSLLSLLLICIMLVSCAVNYTDSLSSQELMWLAREVIDTESGMRWLDEDIMLEFADDMPEYLRDFAVVRSNDAKNINEIGVFRAQQGHATEVFDMASRYIQSKQSMYRAMNYFPEEQEKVDNATVKIFGNYVVYSFLNEKDTSALYTEISDALK